MKNTEALKSLLDSKVDMTDIKTIKSIETEAQQLPARIMPVSEVIELLNKIDDAIAELNTMHSTISDVLDKHIADSQDAPDTDADES